MYLSLWLKGRIDKGISSGLWKAEAVQLDGCYSGFEKEQWFLNVSSLKLKIFRVYVPKLLVKFIFGSYCK